MAGANTGDEGSHAGDMCHVMSRAGDTCHGTRDNASVVIHTSTLTRSLSRRGAAIRKILDPDIRETLFMDPDSGVSSAQSTETRAWCATCQEDTCGCGQDSIVI